MTVTVTIDSSYNGPPDSGNGGYSCGLLARYLSGPARVRLHVPPPLNTPLAVSVSDDGTATLCQDDTVVGTATPATLDLEVPEAPSPEAAEAASAGYVGHTAHTFPTCYVCGPGRPARDGLNLFTGPVAGKNMVACLWSLAPDARDARGNLRDELLWAALDCPGYFACLLYEPRPGPAVLGELTAQIRQPRTPENTLVVYAWPIGRDGRKLRAGSAVATADGNILACASSTWIELRRDP